MKASDDVTMVTVFISFTWMENFSRAIVQNFKSIVASHQKRVMGRNVEFKLKTSDGENYSAGINLTFLGGT